MKKNDYCFPIPAIKISQSPGHHIQNYKDKLKALKKKTLSKRKAFGGMVKDPDFKRKNL